MVNFNYKWSVVIFVFERRRLKAYIDDIKRKEYAALLKKINKKYSSFKYSSCFMSHFYMEIRFTDKVLSGLTVPG